MWKYDTLFAYKGENMETKICRICGIEKKLEQFRKSGKYYRSECKECEKEYKKEYDKKYQPMY